MNDLPVKEILAFLGALVAVVLGALLAEFRTLLQGARERRRALRTLLYQLLELRYQIRTREPKELVALLTKYFSSRGVPDAAKELDTPDTQRQIREALALATPTESGTPFGPAYQQAVDALAPYDPIFAYGLKGQERVLDLDQKLKLYFQKVVTPLIISHDPTQLENVHKVESATVSAALREALEELALKIRSVARKLWPFTLKRANKIIKLQDDLSSAEVEKALARFLDNLFAQIAADIEKNQQQSNPPAGAEGNPKDRNV